jgi:hypothetical protein
MQNFKRERLNVTNSSRKEVFVTMQQVKENLNSNQNSSENSNSSDKSTIFSFLQIAMFRVSEDIFPSAEIRVYHTYY